MNAFLDSFSLSFSSSSSLSSALPPPSFCSYNILQSMTLNEITYREIKYHEIAQKVFYCIKQNREGIIVEAHTTVRQFY
jgi:hypothetical protein